MGGGREPSTPCPCASSWQARGTPPDAARLFQRVGHRPHALPRVGQLVALTKSSSPGAGPPLIRRPRPLGGWVKGRRMLIAQLMLEGR
eukprot:scaffold197526_cov30-Tisochrysis_lutea.AAC.1